MMRLVVSTETHQPERTRPPAFAIIDTLECGHTVRVKGSAGLAKKRQCRECQRLRDGARMMVNGVRVLWDEETKLPYMEDGSPVKD